MYLKNNMFTFQGWTLPLKCCVLYAMAEVQKVCVFKVSEYSALA